MAYYIPTVWKSGETRLPCPPPNCAHGWSYLTTLTLPIYWVAHWPRVIWKVGSGILFHTHIIGNNNQFSTPWKENAHRHLLQFRVGFREGRLAPKTNVTNFIHHDFLQFGNQRIKTNSSNSLDMLELSQCSRFKVILSSIVLSQQCCEVYFISLTAEKPILDLTNVISWIHPWFNSSRSSFYRGLLLGA